MWRWGRAQALFAPPKERPTDPQIRDRVWQHPPGLARIEDPGARLGPTRGAHPVIGRMQEEEMRTTSVRENTGFVELSQALGAVDCRQQRYGSGERGGGPERFQPSQCDQLYQA